LRELGEVKRAVENSGAHLMMQTYAWESLRQLRRELVNATKIVKILKTHFFLGTALKSLTREL
jgi:hypothetical protein